MEFQNASVVWPDSVRPEASVIVPEMMSGNSHAELIEHGLHGEDRRLGVQRVEDGLDQQQVHAAAAPARAPPRSRSPPAHRSVTARNAGSFTSGDSEHMRLVGPSAPATNAGCAALARVLVRHARARSAPRGS